MNCISANLDLNQYLFYFRSEYRTSDITLFHLSFGLVLFFFYSTEYHFQFILFSKRFDVKDDNLKHYVNYF